MSIRWVGENGSGSHGGKRRYESQYIGDRGPFKCRKTENEAMAEGLCPLQLVRRELLPIHGQGS
ncbi:hypothetical protein DESC_190146 [Desulfosarcina cetonica]|nr:hypothetical protein DESC_190146 [Desulfosarcina cetonica]